MSTAIGNGPCWLSHLAVAGNETNVARIKPCYELPGRECDACGERQVHLALARFDVDVPKSLDANLLRGEHTLSLEEFDDLVRSLTPDRAIQVSLLPGTCVGKPTFRLLGKPRDFVWDGILPLVSERTLACARERGIWVGAVEVRMTGRAKTIPRYFSFLPVVRRVMAEDWLKQELVECPVCREWWLKPGITLRRIVLIDKFHAAKRRWPANAGVVYSPDLGGMLYSPEFVRACQDARLEGIGFKPGTWT